LMSKSNTLIVFLNAGKHHGSTDNRLRYTLSAGAKNTSTINSSVTS